MRGAWVDAGDMPKKTVQTALPPIPAEWPFATYQLVSAIHEIVDKLKPAVSRLLVLGLESELPAGLWPGVEVIAEKAEIGAWSSLDGLPLKYASGEFSCVVACEVVDQLPEQVRGVFLDELARISSQYTIIISPFDAHVVLSAEESLNETYKSIHNAAHPSVERHLTQGLPDLHAAREMLEAAMGGPAPEIFPVTSLRSWALFEMLRCFSHAFEREEILFSRLNAFYNAKLARFDHAGPVYRHVLLSAKEAKALKPSVVKALSARFDPGTARGEIEVALDLLKLILDGYAETLSCAPPRGVLSRALRRVEELERKTRSQARLIQKLNDEIYVLKGGRNAKAPARLLKKLFNS